MNDPNNPYSAPQTPFTDLPPVAGGRVPANFGQRFVAALIDGVIMWVVNYAVGFAIGLVFGGGGKAGAAVWISFFVGTVLSWLYSALQESSARQGTIGKVAMGVRVTDMSGQQVSFARATGRHFGKYISGLILCIGYLMMLWDPNKQTLHDKLSGCLLDDVKATR